MPAAAKAAPPDPVQAAIDIRQGKIKLADLPPDVQRQVRRVNQFAEGKVIARAQEQAHRPRTFLPATRTRRARLE